jgi:hypothetical protein
VCVLTIITMVMLLRDFGLYGIIFMPMHVYHFRFSRYSGRVIYYVRLQVLTSESMKLHG